MNECSVIAKAKQLRYKKPISRNLNIERIKNDIWEMKDACSDIHWFDDDDESLVAALNGDEDDAYEFKMSFCELEYELERFWEDLNEELVTGYFDILFPAVGADYDGGYLGYDSFEGDYLGLEPYEYSYAESEAGKRLMSLTKKDLLCVVGSCLKTVHQYMSVKYRYDCLNAAFETLRGKNMEKIKVLKEVDKLYSKAADSSSQFMFDNIDVAEFNVLLDNVPQEYWVQ